MRKRHILGPIVLTLLALALANCAAGAAEDDDANDGDTAGGSGAGDGLGASVGSGSGNGDACGADHYDAESAPVDLIFMLDQSGSMDGDAEGGGTLWDAVTSALITFVQDPGAAGLGLSLQYFPLSDGTPCQPCGGGCNACVNGCCAVTNGQPCDNTCGSSICINGQCAQVPGASCEIGDYAAPEVPLATLPGAASAVVASLASHSPTGNTPTGPALQGAIDYASGWLASNPSRKAAVVLATDGKPNACSPNDVSAIAALAAAAAGGSPSIVTFVIGVGDELAELNSIAAAGGTGQAFLVDTNQNVNDQFLAALLSIQDAVLACEYLIPTPTSGNPDYNLVNVEVSLQNQPPHTLPKVPGPADCDADGGWYYDNPAAPEKIIMCPASCDALQADPGAQLDILLGCDSVLK
jgi:hypothetical protein